MAVFDEKNRTISLRSHGAANNGQAAVKDGNLPIWSGLRQIRLSGVRFRSATSGKWRAAIDIRRCTISFIGRGGVRPLPIGVSTCRPHGNVFATPAGTYGSTVSLWFGAAAQRCDGYANWFAMVLNRIRVFTLPANHNLDTLLRCASKIKAGMGLSGHCCGAVEGG